MAGVIDLTGKIFGDLAVIGRAGTYHPPSGRGHRAAIWECRCSCGNIVEVQGLHLRSGRTTCWGKNHRNTPRRKAVRGIWSSMLRRCDDLSDKAYKYYGGREIKVCDRWRDFQTFFADMGPRPSPRHSIDRIDNNGNYEPGNCKWSTSGEQARNKRDTLFVEYEGVRWKYADLCEAMGWDYRLVLKRHLRGWPLGLAGSTPRGISLKSVLAKLPDGA